MRQLPLKYSKIIPFPGFYAITWFGKIYRRPSYKDTPISKTTMNHEGIHVCQAEDFCKGFFGYILFYILYGIEYFIKIIISVFLNTKAYYSISFEQEAYENQNRYFYQDTRVKFAWKKYIFKMVK